MLHGTTFLEDVLGKDARGKSLRYKTANKASIDEYGNSLDRERDKPSYSGLTVKIVSSVYFINQ